MKKFGRGGGVSQKKRSQWVQGRGAQKRVQDSGDCEGVPIKRGVNGWGGGITIKRGSVRCRGEVCGLARGSYSSSLGSAVKKIFVLIQPPF
jgi:hypothetical protein